MVDTGSGSGDYGKKTGPGIVVIGIGNEFRGDDAVGIVVARALLEGPLPSFVRVVEAGLAGPSLLDMWMGADLAIVVDAVRVEGEGGEMGLGQGAGWKSGKEPDKESGMAARGPCSRWDAERATSLPSNLRPGSVVDLTAQEVLLGSASFCSDLASSHGFGLREALQLASSLGYPYMPHRFRVVGVCADRDNLHIAGGGMTHTVERGCVEAVGVIHRAVDLYTSSANQKE